MEVRCFGAGAVHDSLVLVEQSSKVLITLTQWGGRDNVLKPCQALNHLVGNAVDTGFKWPPIVWGAAY